MERWVIRLLDTTELCSHLVHLSHVPIRYYTADAEYQCTYADQGGYPDPLRCDPDLEAMLLEKASVSALGSFLFQEPSGK